MIVEWENAGPARYLTSEKIGRLEGINGIRPFAQSSRTAAARLRIPHNFLKCNDDLGGCTLPELMSRDELIVAADRLIPMKRNHSASRNLTEHNG